MKKPSTPSPKIIPTMAALIGVITSPPCKTQQNQNRNDRKNQAWPFLLIKSDAHAPAKFAKTMIMALAIALFRLLIIHTLLFEWHFHKG